MRGTTVTWLWRLSSSASSSPSYSNILYFLGWTIQGSYGITLQFQSPTPILEERNG